jgi:hypothetical protein
VLEGYTLWPRWLRARRIQVHRRKKGALEDALAVVVRSSDVDAALQERLLGARLASYPVDDQRWRQLAWATRSAHSRPMVKIAIG